MKFYVSSLTFHFFKISAGHSGKLPTMHRTLPIIKSSHNFSFGDQTIPILGKPTLLANPKQILANPRKILANPIQVLANPRKTHQLLLGDQTSYPIHTLHAASTGRPSKQTIGEFCCKKPGVDPLNRILAGGSGAEKKT